MSPFTIVAQREFLSRVRKRTFLLMTLLGPLFWRPHCGTCPPR